MSIKTALKNFTIVTMTALSLAACGSSGGGKPTGTTGDTNTTAGSTTGTIGTNPADPNGASVLSTNSPVVAVTSGGNISLPYVIYADNANSTDSNKVYGIQFSDYDPCTQGTEYGWTTFPGTQSYSVLGFYFPSAPTAQTYTVGTADGDIQAANGALGEKFTAQAANANGIACKATTWDAMSSGTVTLTASDGNTVTGTLSLTLADGSTVTGNFQSGTCSATATGAVSNANATNQCNSEQ